MSVAPWNVAVFVPCAEGGEAPHEATSGRGSLRQELSGVSRAARRGGDEEPEEFLMAWRNAGGDDAEGSAIALRYDVVDCDAADSALGRTLTRSPVPTSARGALS